MKTREEIEKTFDAVLSVQEARNTANILLEVLLDIRDLLQQPRTININGNLQNPDDFVKAISEAVRRGKL